METRHLVGGSFGCEFSAFVIIAELLRPEVARTGNFVSNFCADCAQNLPGLAWSYIWLTLFQILFKSANFRRNYCRTRDDRFCRIEYLQYRHLEPIMMALAASWTKHWRQSTKELVKSTWNSLFADAVDFISLSFSGDLRLF